MTEWSSTPDAGQPQQSEAAPVPAAASDTKHWDVVAAAIRADETVTSKWSLRVLGAGALVSFGIALADFLAAPKGSVERWVAFSVSLIALASGGLAASAWFDMREAIFRLSRTASRLAGQARALRQSGNGNTAAEAAELLANAEPRREALIRALIRGGAEDEAKELEAAIEELRAVTPPG